jgi:hypothetical protein
MEAMAYFGVGFGGSTGLPIVSMLDFLLTHCKRVPSEQNNSRSFRGCGCYP